MIRTGIEVLVNNDCSFKFGDIKKFRSCGYWESGKTKVTAWEDADGYDGKLYSASRKGKMWFFYLESVN